MADSPKSRVLIILLLIVLCGALSPLAVSWYHNSVVQSNQNAAIDALAEFAKRQNEFFKKEGRYAASFQELGGEWSKVQDIVSRNPTEFNGYRFRMFNSENATEQPAGAAQGTPAKTYAIIAVP